MTPKWARRPWCVTRRAPRADLPRMMRHAPGLALCSLLIASWSARAAPDNAARLHAFETQLEANPSATAVLQAWCDAHAPQGTRIAARQVQLAPVPPPAEARRALALE